jgi:hypothetical protein
MLAGLEALSGSGQRVHRPRDFADAFSRPEVGEQCFDRAMVRGYGPVTSDSCQRRENEVALAQARVGNLDLRQR